MAHCFESGDNDVGSSVHVCVCWALCALCIAINKLICFGYCELFLDQVHFSSCNADGHMKGLQQAISHDLFELLRGHLT